MWGRSKQRGKYTRKRRGLGREADLSARNAAKASTKPHWFRGKTHRHLEQTLMGGPSARRRTTSEETHQPDRPRASKQATPPPGGVIGFSWASHVWVVVLTLAAMASGVLLLALAGWFVLAAGMAGLGLYLLIDMHTPSGGIRALALARVGLRYAEQLYAHRVLLEQIAFLRERLFAGLARRRLSQLYRLDHQQQFAKLLLELRWLEQHWPRLFWPSTALIGLLCILSAVWWWFAPLNAALLLLLAALFLIAGGLSAYLGRAGGQAQAASQTGFQRLDTQLVQGLSALNGFAGLNRQHQQRLRWRRKLEQIQQRRALLIAFMQTAWTMVSLMVLMLGTVWLMDSAAVPVVAFWVLMVLGVYQMAASILPAFLDLSRIRRARRYWQAAVQVEDNTAAPVIGHNRAKKGANGADCALFARRLFLTLPGRITPVVDGQTITLKRRTRVLLDGPSGAGKSLLLATLGGLIKPDAGEVLVQQLPVLALDNAQYRSLIGYLPQENEMLADSIAENLRIADPSASDERLWTVLTQVGLAEQVKLREGGLNSDVGDAGMRLSGGQMRRLGWARLLLSDPDMLLLDEPFNGLDAVSRQQLLNKLKTWLADKTVLVVEHDAAEGWDADYCYRLRDGKITPRCCSGGADGDTVERHINSEEIAR